MKRVATAVVLIPLVFALIFFLADGLFVLALAIVAIACTWEYLKLSQAHGAPAYFITLAAVTGIFLVVAVRAFTYGEATGLPALAILLGSFLLLVPSLLIARPLASSDLQKSLVGSSLSLLGILYICVPLLCIIAIRDIYLLGNFFLVVLLLAVWSGDIAAL